MTLTEDIVRRKLLNGRDMPVSNNKVFQFSYKRKLYFAKFYKQSDCFQRETFALENFGAADIPVPKIAFKAAAFDEEGRSLVITEQIKGRTLDSLQRNRHKYNEESGRLLAKIHSLQFAQIARPIQISLKEILHKLKEFAEEENLRHPYFEIAEQTWGELNSPGRDVMSHGDYCDRHIFASQGTISGVIDWEGLRFSKQEYDLGHACALIDIFGRPEDGRNFIRGYGLPFDEQLTRKLMFYYKALFASHWKKVNMETRYQKAMRSIKAQPA